MTITLKYTLTNKQHSDIVLGKDKSFSRSIAINMLPSSKVPDSANLLNKVLETDTEKQEFRRLAAIGLWRLNSNKAIGHLKNALKTVKAPVPLIAVVKCLGRVGDDETLKAIMRIGQTAQGVLASQASFAASLISYRLGLEGNDLPMPSQFYGIPRSTSQKIKFTVASKKESEQFINCLAQEPYGIRISNKTPIQFSCPGGGWMIGFNSDVAGANALMILRQRKTFLGIVAAKHSEDNRYSASYLIFTSPHSEEARIDILISRITGEICWAGTTTSITARQAKFLIKTAGRLGIMPLELEGYVRANGEISITNGSVASRVNEKRCPEKLNIAPI